MIPRMGSTAGFILWSHEGNPITRKTASDRSNQKIIFYPFCSLSDKKYSHDMRRQGPEHINIISANIIYSSQPHIKSSGDQMTQ